MGREVRVIAIDPGKTTGWAAWNSETDKFLAGQMPLFEFLYWYETSMTGDFETVVESYIITAGTLTKSRQYWSLEGIGAIKYLAERDGRKVTMQSPAEAKKFATPEKLKAVGWWVPGKDHAQDAARHLLVFVVRHAKELGFDVSRIM